MDCPRRATSTRLFPPSILVVSCAPAIVERCRVAATAVSLDLLAASLDEAAAIAALRKPIALLTPDDLLSFEASETRELARDVGATWLELDSDVCEGEIAAMLAGAIDAYLRRGARSGAGRYAIIGKGPVEVVALRRAPRTERPTSLPSARDSRFS